MTATLTEAPNPAPLRAEARPTTRIPRLRAMHYEPEPGGAVTPIALRARRAPVESNHPPAGEDHREIHSAIAAVVRVALEVLDGRRSPAQLSRHFDASALRYWTAATRQRRPRTPARLIRMLLGVPRAGAAEVAIVCDIDGRVRALAARFERRQQRDPWRCTALRLG